MAVKLLVKVSTFDVATEELRSEKTIDYNNPRKRAWFNKHSYWAMHNGFAVELSRDFEAEAKQTTSKEGQA